MGSSDKMITSPSTPQQHILPKNPSLFKSGPLFKYGSNLHLKWLNVTQVRGA